MKDPFSEGFFLRSVVLSPDGTTLLNPQASTVSGSVDTFLHHGYDAYAQVEPGDYLSMLEGALRVFSRAGSESAKALRPAGDVGVSVP